MNFIRRWLLKRRYKKLAKSIEKWAKEDRPAATVEDMANGLQGLDVITNYNTSKYCDLYDYLRPVDFREPTEEEAKKACRALARDLRMLKKQLEDAEEERIEIADAEAARGICYVDDTEERLAALEDSLKELRQDVNRLLVHVGLLSNDI